MSKGILCRGGISKKCKNLTLYEVMESNRDESSCKEQIQFCIQGHHNEIRVYS